MVLIYVVVCVLCILGIKEVYDVIDRFKFKLFLVSCRILEGVFIMYRDGEVDIRGVYCAVVVAYLINIMFLELFEGIVEWIVKC